MTTEFFCAHPLPENQLLILLMSLGFLETPEGLGSQQPSSDVKNPWQHRTINMSAFFCVHPFPENQLHSLGWGGGRFLVPQCSTFCVSVAATPLCNAIRFCKQICPQHSDRGVASKVRQGLFLGGAWGMWHDIPTTFRKLREFAATLCVRHCVARDGSQQWCATKGVMSAGA